MAGWRQGWAAWDDFGSLDALHMRGSAHYQGVRSLSTSSYYGPERCLLSQEPRLSGTVWNCN
eukprot:3167112-Amphidinium_carterae.1